MQLHCPYFVWYFVLSAMFQELADCLVSGDSGVRVRSIYYEYNDCMNFIGSFIQLQSIQTCVICVDSRMLISKQKYKMFFVIL